MHHDGKGHNVLTHCAALKGLNLSLVDKALCEGRCRVGSGGGCPQHREMSHHCSLGKFHHVPQSAAE